MKVNIEMENLKKIIEKAISKNIEAVIKNEVDNIIRDEISNKSKDIIEQIVNMIYYNCPRCNGKGIIEKYTHIENGTCFECAGSGSVTKKEKKRIEKDILKEIKRYKTRLANNQNRLENQLKKRGFYSEW